MRVVLAEDSVLLREGVARLLEDQGFEIVAQTGTAEDLMLKVRSYSPNVVIVDIRMPPTHTDEGLRAALEIRRRWPGTGVLVLSQYVERRYATELLTDAGGVPCAARTSVSRDPATSLGMRLPAAPAWTRWSALATSEIPPTPTTASTRNNTGSNGTRRISRLLRRLLDRLAQV